MTFPKTYLINQVISGGQTGADRGGLNAAMACGLPVGGFCPAGRKAENGKIPERYSFLRETNSEDYEHRTALNILEADLTLIFTFGPLTPGSKLTQPIANRNQKHVKCADLLLVDYGLALGLAETIKKVAVQKQRGLVLNVAGSRESKAPGIQTQTQIICMDIFFRLLKEHEEYTWLPSTP